MHKKVTTYPHTSRMGSGERAVTSCDIKKECDVLVLDFIGEP